MAVNYASWPVAKLKKEAAKIEKIIKTKESREKKDVLAKLKSIAKQGGYDLSELMADVSPAAAAAAKATKPAGRPVGRPPGKKKAAAKKSTTKKRAKAKVKFKNPKDPTQTWTGRGRQPLWVAAHLAKGGKIDALKV